MSERGRRRSSYFWQLRRTELLKDHRAKAKGNKSRCSCGLRWTILPESITIPGRETQTEPQETATNEWIDWRNEQTHSKNLKSGQRSGGFWVQKKNGGWSGSRGPCRTPSKHRWGTLEQGTKGCTIGSPRQGIKWFRRWEREAFKTPTELLW